LVEIAVVVILLGIPLTVSLVLSFNFTIWILSKITSSSMALLSMIVVDLLVSLLTPPTLLMLIIYIFALVAVFTTGGLIDFSTFDVIDLRNFMIALSRVIIHRRSLYAISNIFTAWITAIIRLFKK
jgi:hypothetical protein